MPTYSIPGPDGKTYSIDGPAGQSRDQVIAAIERRKQSQPQTGTAERPRRQLWAMWRVHLAALYCVKGSAALAGGTGDLQEMARGPPLGTGGLIFRSYHWDTEQGCPVKQTNHGRRWKRVARASWPA